MASPRDAATLTGESQPLLRSMSQKSVGTLCVFAVASALTISWCLVDSWNRDVASQLFSISEVKKMEVSEKIVNMKADHFDAPFLLAFIQFVFMGIIFSLLFFVLTPKAQLEITKLRHCGGTWCWAVLLATHIFATFWLQALMMPKQPMSLGLFAASRSLEVLAVFALRANVFGTRTSQRELVTVVLMFASAWLLYYAYSQLSQCLCIWSGNGIELTGPALFVVYVLVLLIPAANFVCQESIMTHLEIKPLLLLAISNVGAAIGFVPLLFVAHLAGWEDFAASRRMMSAYPQVYMLVLWLSVQMVASTGLCTALIYTVNSFWAVALRALRVVFWWCKVLVMFYFTSGAGLLSTSLPTESFWSFVMFCGLVLMVAAICAEVRPEAGELKPSFIAREVATPAVPTSPSNVPPPPPPFNEEKTQV